jgi:hypothetical protein
MFFFMDNLRLSDVRYPNEFETAIDPSSLPDDATIWRVMVRP